MRSTVCALVLLSACPLLAAKPPSWTLDDVVRTESIADIQVSPDGRWAVWVHNAPDRDKGEQVGNLVRLELASGRETVLTRGPHGCSRPRWSPDGKRLAFLSARPGAKGRSGEDAKEQLWLLDPTGGEPWPLTEFTRGVLHYDWAGPDALIVVAAEEPATPRGEKDDTVVVEDEKEEKPARLFRIDVASKKVTRLRENRDRIESVAVAPDGRRAVAIHQRSPHFVYDNKIKPAVVLHDLESGESRRVFGEPHWNIQHVQWSPDGRGFYAVDSYNSQPQFAQAGVARLHYYDLARHASMPVDLGWERGLAEQTDNDDLPGFVVTRDGFLALLADGVRNKLARYTRAGDTWRREWVTGAHAGQVFAFQAAADGKTLLYSHSTAGSPAQWYRAELAGPRLRQPRPFAVLNGRQRQLPRARTEVVRWKGAGGDEVEGILYHPHHYRPKEKHPLVVMIHGGPAGADLDAWDDWWMYPVNLVCQRGAFVLRPNYHGSSNYGLKWLEAIARGRYGDLETIDIEKGVDSLIARGLVDPCRLALCGWSNGAVLANRLTTQTTRYKAAVAGAGCVEYVSDWANCEFGDAFDRYYFGASPLDDPLRYLLKSPFYRLHRVRTPTLILFGEEDRTVPVSQGWVQYRALQQLGKTEVRFVLFSGEKHVLKKLAHQRRKVKEELAWLDRYLFRVPAKTEPPVKPDSPLARALQRQQARRDAGRYGLLVKGQLVPETVPFGALSVGRFEVTRAQFAAFDKSYQVEPGRANYPANGITFERAKDYCAWLSKRTGRTYRLPAEDEADELYGGEEGGENTLDHWAGYAVNPDDAERLREHLKALDGAAPLLSEVGRFRAAGTEAAVFDLGGNVAEWVTTKDGKGVLRGGSADAPADAKAKKGPAAAEYRGLRVIKERAEGS